MADPETILTGGGGSSTSGSGNSIPMQTICVKSIKYEIKIPYESVSGKSMCVTGHVEVNEKTARVTNAQEALNVDLGTDKLRAVAELFTEAAKLVSSFPHGAVSETTPATV